METTLIILWSLFLIGICIFLIKKIKKSNKKLPAQLKNNNINENSYQRYMKFYGETIPLDQEFQEKLEKINTLVMKNQITNIKEIANQSKCNYHECIMKLRYLKNKRVIPDKYYIDEVNGMINISTPEEQKLLNKYKLYIYNNHFQLPQIVQKLPGTTQENYNDRLIEVWQDLTNLDKKDLINGIVLNQVDKKIIYYSLEKKKNYTDKITYSCKNCGALNEVERGNKIKCEYCGTIIEGSKKEEE